jgi:hypothetical protein
MLIVNAAPLDQSGRTVALYKHYQKKTQFVRMLTYSGIRSPSEAAKSMDLRYFYEIKTGKRGILGPVLRVVKFCYLNTVISREVVREYLLKKGRKGRRGRHVCPSEKYKDSVLFVLPPTAAFIFPFLIASLLGMNIMLDWHRVTSGWIRRVNDAMSRRACNICVTPEMAAYWRGRGVSKSTVITDLDLLNEDAHARMQRRCGREDGLKLLAQKYPEYRDALEGIESDKALFICSTSFSPEENVEDLLAIVESLPETCTGALIVTTKHEFVCKGSSGVVVSRMFLDHPDYLLLLSVADFGISTHKCCFDFPLKIVDYLSMGLHVIAHLSTPRVKTLENNSGSTLYSSNEELREIIISKMNGYVPQPREVPGTVQTGGFLRL